MSKPTGRPGMPFWRLLDARLREMRREPEVIFWVFVFPLLMTFGLGIAFRSAPPHPSEIAVVAGHAGDAAAEQLAGAPDLHVTRLEAGAALDGFRLGRYDLVVLSTPGGAPLLRYDPARPETRLARLQVLERLGVAPPADVESVAASEPGARYIDFLIPGLLGMNLMNSGMWGIGFALVEMRQRKLLKRLVATPMRRTDFLAALIGSRLVLMLLELALLLGAGIVAFHVRVLGNWGVIVLTSALGALCFGGLGLLVASRAAKIESVSGLMNLVMMPMWVLSGVFFSYERFPAAVLPLIRLLPLTALNDALRAVILEGAPLHAQMVRLAIVAAWGSLSFLLALRWFRWT